ncbi:hypothetical protein H5S40_05845 [Limosilactobacillus sp. RRLNB_1_1]|uniref:Uncharacterized protein n=2 Tax=Limosilactobacillus albertensis TaxID=2759752 RepID=A0A7W3Y8H4_9LACO|nr:hypothetical protein [Limosilactobacillus albertensis]
MTIIKPFKYLKIISLTIFIKLLTIQSAFASMGSTGGGSHHHTSTGDGTGRSYSGSSSNGANSIIIFIFLIGVIIYLYSFVKRLIISIRETSDTRKVAGLAKWMLMPNMTISRFKNSLEEHQINLAYAHQLDDELVQNLIDTYAKAQFTYGQSIRRCFTGNHDYLNILKQQLGYTFLKTMQVEIKNKAAEGIIDDVMVNRGKMLAAKQVSTNVIIAKVQAFGLDNEVNVLSQFNSSFKRQQWTDYVVFGREAENGKWKIYNIVYGAHFHLNGKDYNKQSSLDKGKIIEQHLEVSPDLVKQAKAYKRRITWQKRCLILIPLTLIILALLYWITAPAAVILY